MTRRANQRHDAIIAARVIGEVLAKRNRLRREAALLSQHPEDEVINGWIESVYDWDSWK